MKNLPANRTMIARYRRNLSKPNTPTSSSAVGSRSSGPTFSPLAIFSSRNFLRSSHALCSASCLSRYSLCLERKSVSLGNPTSWVAVTYARKGLLAGFDETILSGMEGSGTLGCPSTTASVALGATRGGPPADSRNQDMVSLALLMVST